MTLLVPYRGRPDQFSFFINYMGWFYPELDIIIVEQSDDKPFNRGKLFNVSFLESELDYFICHDIDCLPINCPYSARKFVTQLIKSDIQKRDYLGGVTMFDKETFIKIGGYHNDYFHRAEDNEIRFHLQRLRIPILERFYDFKQIPHERTGPEFIPELWQKAQLPRTKNMLKTCEYKLISKELKNGYTHLKVEL